jgi:hypothetical protein
MDEQPAVSLNQDRFSFPSVFDFAVAGEKDVPRTNPREHAPPEGAKTNRAILANSICNGTMGVRILAIEAAWNETCRRCSRCRAHQESVSFVFKVTVRSSRKPWTLDSPDVVRGRFYFAACGIIFLSVGLREARPSIANKLGTMRSTNAPPALPRQFSACQSESFVDRFGLTPWLHIPFLRSGVSSLLLGRFLRSFHSIS